MKMFSFCDINTQRTEEEELRIKHKQVMVIKRPLFPICFYRTVNTYDKFVISYLVPLITL